MTNNSTPDQNLGQLLQSKVDLVDYFYNDTKAPHVKARAGLTPVPFENLNWVVEQNAWRQAAVMFDQSHHMPELFVRGRDALRLLRNLGVNSFAKFKPGVAKQFIVCNHEGYVIGESLVYCHSEEEFEMVSGMPCLNWVEFNARTGGYDVELLRDNHTAANPSGRRVKFRFGMDGPNAAKIFANLVEGDVPEIKFFHTAKVRIAGRDVMALRHGMAGHQGVELSGDYEDGPAIREAMHRVGKEFGLVEGGTLAYFSTVAESGWMASPFPAVYTDPGLKAYRDWLPSSSWEANAQLGGSFYSENIYDYYMTPWDLGVDGRIRFDHDFIGREALEAKAQKPERARRTLIWNPDDVDSIMRSLLEPGTPCKMLRMPTAAYAFQQYDAVRSTDGKLAARSNFVGYSSNERKMLSLASVDLEHAEPGTELVLTWGEPNGGSRKPHVEPHRQCEVRVTVAPAPYADTVRQIKHNVVNSDVIAAA
ncbi:aminomethyl transferase family protein [Sphingopyxis sp.]|uniref:aminomethyl transferase family protein n=1 Tax=Sphingopyxis sp. TaxID=1908224 RepID=UPI002D785A18|nr:aminomethyl transferase family protein [Sphingopyxis sp.]HET6522882.1 aminomethyl transferase family protein [Sphingopyxis sp.]